MKLLSLDQVTCVRGGRLLFEDMNLSLGAGEAAIVTGPNGAGKSSLIRIAAGLLDARAGRVERPVETALADENAALDLRLTLGQALAFWAHLDGVHPEAGMGPMGLSHLKDMPVRMLSTGQRKRAALARVVASGAPLWLLDEPANGLDAEGLQRLNGLVGDHLLRGGALLAASHQPLDIAATTVMLG